MTLAPEQTRPSHSTRRKYEQLIWDVQYFLGFWRYIDGTPDRDVSAVINEHLRGGNILDLGCGTGNVVRVIRDYTLYQGVDISNVAIRRARKRYASDKNRFAVANIVEFQPDDLFDVILLSEVIYYIALEDVRPFLERYKQHLKARGAFVVRVWDKELRKDYIDLVAGHYEILDTRSVSGMEKSVVISFR